ncbi:60S ribosomal protein L34-like [Phyllostomus hastatus]|uniref:60S ribosomal protein L34-like n=1 Tax=Phyllostomus hastatus TaxID=9423 RepID=UPI001E6834C2|nr:60S ribosomal protein L34-like [Phyllostomus hastatus]
MVWHLIHCQRWSYNIASNKLGCPRPPGNRTVYLHTKKVGKAPSSACGVCPGRLCGVPAVRPKALMRLSETKKPTSGACGGSECAQCVCERAKCALLTEEQNTIVKLLKAQAQGQKAKFEKMKLI